MKKLRTLFAALLMLAALSPARATSVVPLYLDELIDTAAVAFDGKVLANRVERDPATNLVVTYTTFEVREMLKGAVGATHTIKQVGGTLAAENVRYHVEGIPAFTVGESYVVFLAGVSDRGFSSPMGLSQGRFGIQAGGAGLRVSNGRDFRDMTARMASRLPGASGATMKAAREPVRDMDLGEFKQAVRNHLAGAK